MQERKTIIYGFSAHHQSMETATQIIGLFLQRIKFHLQDSTDYNFIVKNYGVLSYTSWQQLTSLQMEIMKGNKPDLVIVFNFHVDYLQLYNKPTDDCNHLLETGLLSKKILTSSWNNIASEKYIFYENLFGKFKSFFPATNELTNVLWKVPLVIENKIRPLEKKISIKEKNSLSK